MADSRPPTTSQTGPHRQLEATVGRHLARPWRAPIHDYSRRALDAVVAWIDPERPLWLDSGCGTGESTARLARRRPDVQVLGIDKSAARLGRAPELPGNARLIRADVADVWRLVPAAGVSVARHYLFYPNPWPKPGHLKRRWHAHPGFPALLALGGRLELRTNFALYAEEFVRALALAGVVDAKVVSFQPDFPVSPFERKYALSGHDLFKVTAQLE
jgi:tRNA (guanine-N7-)-methyltransferase